jgi:hypothetical protein
MSSQQEEKLKALIQEAVEACEEHSRRTTRSQRFLLKDVNEMLNILDDMELLLHKLLEPEQNQ